MGVEKLYTKKPRSTKWKKNFSVLRHLAVKAWCIEKIIAAESLAG